MKITKTKLKQIIQEELAKVVNEQLPDIKPGGSETHGNLKAKAYFAGHRVLSGGGKTAIEDFQAALREFRDSGDQELKDLGRKVYMAVAERQGDIKTAKEAPKGSVKKLQAVSRISDAITNIANLLDIPRERR